MRSIPVEVAVATAVVVLTTVMVSLLVRRTRAKGTDGRVELAVVPTSGFDPSIEEIIRYAGHLVRTRRLRDVVTGRRGRTVRLSLRSVGEGQLVQTIDVSESAAAMVRRHPLDGVEMITLAELDRRIAGVVGADSSQPDQEPTGSLGPPDRAEPGAQQDGRVDRGPAGSIDGGGGSTPLRAVEGDDAGIDGDQGGVRWPSVTAGRRSDG